MKSLHRNMETLEIIMDEKKIRINKYIADAGITWFMNMLNIKRKK